MTVGILLVANEEPTEGTIVATQVLLGLGSAGAGLSSLSLFSSAISGKAIDPTLAVDKGNYQFKDLPTEYRTGFAVGGVLLAGAAVGLGIWTAQLDDNLSLAETYPKGEIVKSKVARFFMAAKKLEKEWCD